MQQELIQKVWKTGNSNVVSIPSDIMRDMNISVGQRVKLNIIVERTNGVPSTSLTEEKCDLRDFIPRSDRVPVFT